MNRLLIILGVAVGGAAIIGGGALLRAKLGGRADVPLVNCEAAPNSESGDIFHDREFKFLLALNGKNKNSGNFELDSVSISDNGIALHSDIRKLRIDGPAHPGLVDTVTIEKNAIVITPVNDVRKKTMQEILLHVAVKLRRKKGGAMTTTSAICKTIISHSPIEQIVPAKPPVEPPVKPPILIKDKAGDWVEPTKKTTTPTAPTTPITTGLTKTPSFDSRFDVGTTDGVTTLGVGITPQDAVGRKFVRIEIPLFSRTYTFGTPKRISINVNQNGWYSSDWNCGTANDVVNCQGATPLAVGIKTPIVMEMPFAIGTPPQYINANVYDDQGGKIGLGVEYRQGSVLGE